MFIGTIGDFIGFPSSEGLQSALIDDLARATSAGRGECSTDLMLYPDWPSKYLEKWANVHGSIYLIYIYIIMYIYKVVPPQL